MEEQKKEVVMPTLVQNLTSTNYKLVIPIEVERKIRYTCNKVWNTEWSGALFFNHEGSFENDDLVIRCLDIFIMDIGSATYTEFDMSPDVISYMCEHSELLGCQIGLIHSHSTFSTFFSGTDQATLREEGTDRNNFVSLIVNNAGTYTAAITRRTASTKSIHDCYSYEFFGDGKVEECKDYEESNEIIEWFCLKIEKEMEDTSLDELSCRLEEIKKNKEEASKKSTFINPNYSNMPHFNGSFKKESYNVNPVSYKQGNLFEENAEKALVTMPKEKDDVKESFNIPYGEIRFNKETIKSLVAQIVTGCVLINSDKIDINKWASNMSNSYEKRFGEGKEGYNNFTIWAETYCEYLTWYVQDNDLLDLGLDDTEICAICSYDLIEELEKLPKNKYIQGYIDALEKYVKL